MYYVVEGRGLTINHPLHNQYSNIAFSFQVKQLETPLIDHHQAIRDIIDSSESSLINLRHHLSIQIIIECDHCGDETQVAWEDEYSDVRFSYALKEDGWEKGRFSRKARVLCSACLEKENGDEASG